MAHHGRTYKSKHASSTIITDRVDISQRPTIVERRARIGDFEIDTVVSAKYTGKSTNFDTISEA